MPFGPIQPLPGGLLSALELKNRGVNPPLLSEEVHGVIDLTHWYHNTDVLIQDAALAVALPANLVNQGVFTFTAGNLLTVPDGEVWYVRDFNVSVYGAVLTSTAFQVRNLAPAALYRETGAHSGSRGVLIGDGLDFDSTAFTAWPANGAVVYSRSMSDFWAPAGMSFGFSGAFELTDPAAGMGASGFARVDRFSI